jgi:hypothetical protein
MDFIAPPDLRFTLPQLRRFITEGVRDFLLDGGSTGEAEQSRELMKAFLGYMESKIVKLGEQEKGKLTTIDNAPVPTSPSFGSFGNTIDTAPVPRSTSFGFGNTIDTAPVPTSPSFGSFGNTIDTAPVPRSTSFGFGKVNLKRTSITPLRKNRIMIMPMQASTALSVLNSPEALQCVKFYNEDLDTENKMVLQMNNFVQEYTEEEEAMITSGLGLISSLKMKGAILFKGE